jgi:tRNA A37 threonylcarbamoyladenosine modification protein TsaB
MRTLILDRSSAFTHIAYDGRTCSLDGRDDTWVAQLRDFLKGETPEALAVGLGPGSFAGIRAAIACLQGLGIAWQLQPRGFPSAAVLAAASGLPEVTVVGDARRNTLWTVRYRVTETAIEQLGDFELRKRETFVADATAVSPDAHRLTEFNLPAVEIKPELLESVVTRLGDTLTADPKPYYLHPAVGAADAK